MTLNQTQRSMMAASLEIDGRADYAAAVAVTGHVWEFRSCGRTGNPVSSKAVQRQELQAWLTESIELLGMEGLITALRVA